MSERDQLKRDIIAYLQSVGVNSKELWVKTLDTIKGCSYSYQIVGKEVSARKKEVKQVGLKDGDRFYYLLTTRFSPRHYSTLVGFVQRYEKILEEEEKQEDKLLQALEDERLAGAVDDFDYDEIGAPDFAVVVYEDYVEARAYGPGVGEMLPKKNRKYVGCQGNIKWRYPLSSLPELQQLGWPVIKVSELDKK